MREKISQIIFLIIFMLMILVPVMFIDLSGGNVSEQENRILATRPAISTMSHSPSDFIEQFDDWFSDNVGFRESLISMYRMIEEAGNPIQYTDGQYTYLIGENGHRYFAHTDGLLISKFQGKQFLSDDQLHGLSKGMKKIEQELEERNIPLIVMIPPDKESVYPEYYPKEIIRGPEPDQLEIITEHLNENINATVYNCRQRLVDEKENYLPYNKAVGDLSHYNKIGGFFEYIELMEQINIYFPDIKPYTIEDVNITYDEDNIPSVLLKQETTCKKLESNFFDGVEMVRPFGNRNKAFENSDQTLPTILFICDSYAGIFADYVVPHFSKTILLHNENVEHLEEYLDSYKPDIVVFESAERELQGFANNIIEGKATSGE